MYERYPILTKVTVGLLFLVLLVYSVEAAREILVPVMLAMLFAFLLHPFASKLEEWKVPRAAADFTVVALASLLVVSIFFLFYKQMGVFLHDLPKLRLQAIQNIARIEGYIEDHISLGDDGHAHWLETKVSTMFSNSQGQIGTTFTTTAASLGKLLILPFIIFFMLFYRERFGEFVLEIVPPRKHDDTQHIIEEVSKVTRRYMGGLFIVVIIIGTMNCIGLSLIGIKYALFLGLLACMFNFIPYFGTPIGAIIPVTVTFLTNESLKPTLFVILYFFAVQLLEHNILTPRITGSQVRINPLFTVFSILIGAMMFGVAGMFLAIPFTGIFKIFCEHVETLKPLAKIIGDVDKPDRALTPLK